MKRKLILPLLAIVFALASAFATSDSSQMAWYHVAPFSNAEGVIDNTELECQTGLDNICRIGGKVAYDSPTAANTQNSSAILKYPN